MSSNFFNIGLLSTKVPLETCHNNKQFSLGSEDTLSIVAIQVQSAGLSVQSSIIACGTVITMYQSPLGNSKLAVFSTNTIIVSQFVLVHNTQAIQGATLVFVSSNHLITHCWDLLSMYFEKSLSRFILFQFNNAVLTAIYLNKNINIVVIFTNQLSGAIIFYNQNFKFNRASSSSSLWNSCVLYLSNACGYFIQPTISRSVQM